MERALCKPPNLTNMSSVGEAESEVLGVASPTSQAEIAEVVKKLLRSKTGLMVEPEGVLQLLMYHSSPGKFISGCWKGGSDQNFIFRRSNADTVDQLFTLAGSLGGKGSFPIQFTCVLWT